MHKPKLFTYFAVRFDILACFFTFMKPPLIAEVFLYTGVYIKYIQFTRNYVITYIKL